MQEEVNEKIEGSKTNSKKHIGRPTCGLTNKYITRERPKIPMKKQRLLEWM